MGQRIFAIVAGVGLVFVLTAGLVVTALHHVADQEREIAKNDGKVQRIEMLIKECWDLHRGIAVLNKYGDYEGCRLASGALRFVAISTR